MPRWAAISAQHSSPNSARQDLQLTVNFYLSEATNANTLAPVRVSDSEVGRVRSKNPFTVMTTDQVILTFTGGNFPSSAVRRLKTYAVVLYLETKECFSCYGLNHIQSGCSFIQSRCRRCKAWTHLCKDCTRPSKCVNCRDLHEATWGTDYNAPTDYNTSKTPHLAPQVSQTEAQASR